MLCPVGLGTSLLFLMGWFTGARFFGTPGFEKDADLVGGERFEWIDLYLVRLMSGDTFA